MSLASSKWRRMGWSRHMAHIREKRNACPISERKSECWRSAEGLCVIRYRFSGVDKASAFLAARRPRGSGRPSDVQNTKICCEFFGILFHSSDRRIFLWQLGVTSLIIKEAPLPVVYSTVPLAMLLLDSTWIDTFLYIIVWCYGPTNAAMPTGAKVLLDCFIKLTAIWRSNNQLITRANSRYQNNKMHKIML